ncbi:F-box domain-containing protein [Favolaschia claudopus]|uniref:F-box domain-containing protein n=1 Tax=Favolaschia claudopus TaxID=2862362 RepID=A0AAW0D7Q6_9AGAR
MLYGFATELWEEIISYFTPEEDRQALLCLNLVDHRFHHIARRRIFADFKFCPYSVRSNEYGMHAEELALPVIPTPEWLRQRLELWASDDIAPFVDYCVVEPLEFEKIERPYPDEDPYVLMKLFYELLPRFINLKSLFIFAVHLTDNALTNLARMPKLHTLILNRIAAVEGETLNVPSKLKLRAFEFANCGTLGEWWLDAACLDTLEELEVGLYLPYCPRFLGDSMLDYPIFPNVRTLSIDIGQPVFEGAVMRLANFPGTKDLTLTRAEDIPGRVSYLADAQLPQEYYCPLLERYTGPLSVLPFLRTSLLENLTIDPCNPADFFSKMRSLQMTARATTMKYLKVSLLGYISSLHDLGEIFPDLAILRVSMLYGLWYSLNPDPQMAVSFFASLPSSLPPNIAKLAIDWEFKEPPESAPADFEQLKNAIVAQRPSLKTLWIHCGQCAYAWGVMPDGTESVMSGGPDFATRILPKFDTVFYGWWRTE